MPLTQIFQDVCKMKVNWDAQLPHEISHKWGELMLDIAENALVDIDRCFLIKIINIEIHGFSDANNIAYGAAIHLRVIRNHVTIIRLLAAKSKLAPLKKETTPRLELKAAVVLVQLIQRDSYLFQY